MTEKPEIMQLMEDVSTWALRRETLGDVTAEALVDNICETIKTKLLPAMRQIH